MIPPARNRTTSTPGTVDLPPPRRSSKEVALAKKKKNDAASAKAEAMKRAAARVVEIEGQVAAAQNKGSRNTGLAPKQPCKRPATGTGQDVSFFDHQSDDLFAHSSHVPQVPAAPSSSRLDTASASDPPRSHGKKRKADEQLGTGMTKRKGIPRYVAQI